MINYRNATVEFSSVRTLISLLHVSLLSQVSNKDVYALSRQRLDLIRFRVHRIRRGEDSDAIKARFGGYDLIRDRFPDGAGCADDKDLGCHVVYGVLYERKGIVVS